MRTSSTPSRSTLMIDGVQRQELLELKGPLLRSEALVKLLEQK